MTFCRFNITCVCRQWLHKHIGLSSCMQCLWMVKLTPGSSTKPSLFRPYINCHYITSTLLSTNDSTVPWVYACVSLSIWKINLLPKLSIAIFFIFSRPYCQRYRNTFFHNLLLLLLVLLTQVWQKLLVAYTGAWLLLLCQCWFFSVPCSVINWE